MITRGFTDTTIVTRGFAWSVLDLIVRDIARLTSAVILSVSLSSAVKLAGAIISRAITSVTVISKLDIEEDD